MAVTALKTNCLMTMSYYQTKFCASLIAIMMGMLQQRGWTMVLTLEIICWCCMYILMTKMGMPCIATTFMVLGLLLTTLGASWLARKVERSQRLTVLLVSMAGVQPSSTSLHSEKTTY